MISDSLFVSCARCALCEGNGYQVVPALVAGPIDAPILVIGQNPGEIKSTDTTRLYWASVVANHVAKEKEHSSVALIHIWYTWDFGTSSGATKMASVLGPNWMTNGQFAFTNAVRCRTVGNKPPSDDMRKTCTSWTQMLLSQRKGIIMMGGVARFQVLGDDAVKLPWGQVKRHPQLGLILAIKHYSSWADPNEVKQFHDAVSKMFETAKI